MNIIVLPGLDGSSRLLSGFCKLAPANCQVEVFPIPDDPTADYETLCEHFSQQIQGFDACHLIAESYSGPLGILLAHRHPENVERLTLVATFAAQPAPRIARFIPWSLLFRLPMPSLVARKYLVGCNQSLLAEVKQVVRMTSPATLVRRVHNLLDVDVTEPLSRLNCRIDYIRASRDRLVGRHCLDKIIEVNPSVFVYEIDGPHLILQTRPEQAWQIILHDRTGEKIPQAR